MKTEGLEKIIIEHKLFEGLGDSFAELVAGCARNVRFDEGDYLIHEGDDADEIYLLRQGHVSLMISSPGHGSMTFDTPGPNDLIGLSWLVPPYRWTFDARANEPVRAIALDANCLRDKCELDHALGYEILKRVMPVIVDRLHTTRVQLLDVYGKPS